MALGTGSALRQIHLRKAGRHALPGHRDPSLPLEALLGSRYGNHLHHLSRAGRRLPHQHLSKDAGPLERIRELHLDVYGGCFNNRPVRGAGRPSLHAWGIAVDLDPLRNAMYMRAPEAAFSGPEYDAFWSIVEGEGAFSLGRELG